MVTTLKEATLIKRHWELWLKEKRTGINLSNKRRILKANTKDEDPLDPSEQQAITLLNREQKHLRKVKLKAKELREEFLVQRAELYTKLGEMSKANKVQLVRKGEALSHPFVVYYIRVDTSAA